jgi:hypothetical protein
MIEKSNNRIETSFRGYLRLLESTDNMGLDVFAFEHQDYDLFVHFCEVMVNVRKLAYPPLLTHKWRWDIHMASGAILVVTPYTDSDFTYILITPGGRIVSVDYAFREPVDLKEFGKKIGGIKRLVKDPSYRSNLRNLLMKLTAKSKLSMLKGEIEGEDD